MLQVDVIAPKLNTAPPAAFTTSTAKLKDTRTTSTQLIEITFRTVEMDGSNLWREPEEVATGQLAEAIRLADLRDKPELKINNIAPWIAVGDTESRQVPILQKKIQASLAKACKKFNRPVPECRLDLARGEYSIRCYLGRIKPTDHVFDEDFVSDSR